MPKGENTKGDWQGNHRRMEAAMRERVRALALRKGIALSPVRVLHAAELTPEQREQYGFPRDWEAV